MLAGHEPISRRVETRFQFRDLLKVFAFSIVLYAAFAALFAVVPNAASTIESLPPAASFVIQYLLQFVILFFPLWIMVVNKYETTLKDFGFNCVHWKTMVKTVLLTYLFYLAVSTGISFLLTALDLKLPGYDAQESYIPLFGTSLLDIGIGFFFVALVAPFLEELLFRGFVYRIFTKMVPLWVGSILTAGLFALAHMQLQTFFPLFLLGLLLNHSYSRTGSVWTAVAFHSLNNIIAFSVDIYFTTHPSVLEEVATFLYTVKI